MTSELLPKLSISAQKILKEAGLKTKEAIEIFHRKKNLTALRNCGYKTANEILTYYKLPLAITHCPECKRELISPLPLRLKNLDELPRPIPKELNNG